MDMEKKMKKLLSYLFVVIVIINSANATVLTPDSASTSLTPFSPFSVEQTIDGIFFGNNNGFVVDGDVKTGTFQYEFNTSYDLLGFTLYNDAGVSAREGIKAFSLNFFDSSDNLVDRVENLETNPSNRLINPDVFSFSEVSNVARVDLVVLDSYDDGNLSRVQLQFTEVQFNSSVVPIPAAVWLFCSGLIGLVGMKKRAVKLPSE